MFFTQEGEGEVLDVPMALQTSLLICTVATLWIGVYPSAVLDWVNTASVQLLSVVP
jgi:NADH:ubiquinone oxidoreductase subunit 4 (subunit M)